MRNYVFNFFLWWYWINGKSIFSKLITSWRYTLESLNLVPMLKNFFTPLYQDYSWEGKLVAIPFRFLWVIFGIFFQIVYTLALLVVLIGYFLCPFIPVFIVVLNLK